MNALIKGPVPVTGESRLLIDGQLTEARSGARYPNLSPVTEQVLGTVADADVDDAAAAIAAARRAFDESGWATDRALRQRCLTQLRDGLRSRLDELCEQVMAEVGATMAITVNGPQGSGPLEILDYYLELMQRYRWEEELPVTRHMGVPSKRLLWREAAGVRSEERRVGKECQ